MAAVLRIVCKPFLVVHKKAVKGVAAMSASPIKRQIEVHESSGEDLCSKATKEYFSWQSQLISYRKQRLQEEWNYIRHGGVSLATATYRDYILLLRFLTKLLTMFLAGVMLGRRSVFPLIPPSSHLFEANESSVVDPTRRAFLGLKQ